MLVRSHRHGLLFNRCHGLEAVAVALPVGEVVGGHGQLRIDIAELSNLLFQHDQPISMRKRQRPEHHIPNKRENRRGRADSKRQGQYDRKSKARHLAQLAQCMPHILEQLLHTRPRSQPKSIELAGNFPAKPYAAQSTRVPWLYGAIRSGRRAGSARNQEWLSVIGQPAGLVAPKIANRLPAG